METATTTGAGNPLAPTIATGSTELVAVEPSSTALAQVAANPAAARQALMCKDSLTSGELADAQAKATKLYPALKDNPQVLHELGANALTGINKLSAQLLGQVDPEGVPVIQAHMRELNDGMRAIKGKYDLKDPKVREKYEHWKGGVGRFLGHGKSFIEMLLEDIQSFQKQMEKIRGELYDDQKRLVTNAGHYDDLYKENELAIRQLVFEIAVMELLVDMIGQEVASIVVDQSKPDHARDSERRARLAEIGTNLEVKIGDYKGRLMIAWATAPKVRMSKSLNDGMISKLDNVADTILPVMEQVLAQWAMDIQTGDAQKMALLLSDTANTWVSEYMADSGELAQQIADTVQTPTIKTETIDAMAEAISKQADDMVAAMEAGRERRLEVDEAIRRAIPVLNDANRRVGDAMVSDVLGATAQLEAATPALPAAS